MLNAAEIEDAEIGPRRRWLTSFGKRSARGGQGKRLSSRPRHGGGGGGGRGPRRPGYLAPHFKDGGVGNNGRVSENLAVRQIGKIDTCAETSPN